MDPSPCGPDRQGCVDWGNDRPDRESTGCLESEGRPGPSNHGPAPLRTSGFTRGSGSPRNLTVNVDYALITGWHRSLWCGCRSVKVASVARLSMRRASLVACAPPGLTTFTLEILLTAELSLRHTLAHRRGGGLDALVLCTFGAARRGSGRRMKCAGEARRSEPPASSRPLIQRPPMLAAARAVQNPTRRVRATDALRLCVPPLVAARLNPRSLDLIC